MAAFTNKRTINDLPVELLRAVFSLIMDELDPADCVGMSDFVAVCSYWRSIAFESPTLWTSFTTPVLRGPLLRRRLILAKDLPLDISLILRDRRPTDGLGIRNAVSRGKNVLLMAAHPMSTKQASFNAREISELLSLNMPDTFALYIKWSRTRHGTSPVIQLHQLRAPNLHRLAIDGVSFVGGNTLNGNLPELRSLIIANPPLPGGSNMRTWKETLACLPSLSELVVDNAIPEPIGRTMAHSKFATLQHVAVRCALPKLWDLFEAVEAPCLRSLQAWLSLDDTHEPRIVANIVDALCSTPFILIDAWMAPDCLEIEWLGSHSFRVDGYRGFRSMTTDSDQPNKRNERFTHFRPNFVSRTSSQISLTLASSNTAHASTRDAVASAEATLMKHLFGQKHKVEELRVHGVNMRTNEYACRIGARRVSVFSAGTKLRDWTLNQGFS